MKHKKQLLILPFDHRSSFSKKLMGYEGKLRNIQVEAIAKMKRIVFDGFRKVASGYRERDNFGILVDEQFGASILKDALKMKVQTCSPVEKSGQEVFDFEYGSKFRAHIEKMNPTNVKCLVRYNPANRKENRMQLKRLKQLSDYCNKTGRRLLFELLVPPTKRELKEAGSKKRYDRTKRIINTIKALKEIDKELYVDVWKLEGFDTAKAWKDIILAIKQGQNPGDFEIIVLGRGEDKAKVIEWLKLAARFPEITGFAVGRTIFFQPLKQFKEKKITRAKAVDKIAANYRFFVNLWLREKKIKLE